MGILLLRDARGPKYYMGLWTLCVCVCVYARAVFVNWWVRTQKYVAEQLHGQFPCFCFVFFEKGILKYTFFFFFASWNKLGS